MLRLSRFRLSLLSAAIALGASPIASSQAQTPMTNQASPNGIHLQPPPPTEIHPVEDDYFGTKIVDKYRWLEQAQSPETRDFLKQQNEYTSQYLAQIKSRPEMVKQLTALHRTDVWGMPRKAGNRYFYIKRLAEENQGSIYFRVGLHGKEERLVDATKLSADQNTSVSIVSISDDGQLLVYGVRQGGADEQEIHVLQIKDRKELADRLPSSRYFGMDLSPDKKGLYYSRFTHEGTLVYFHRFGTPADSDVLLFGKEYRGQKLGEMDLISVGVTDDGNYLVLDISHGVPAKRVDVLIKDLRQTDSPFEPLVYGIDARFSLIENADQFYFQTDYKAPKGRILKAEKGKTPDAWTTIIPETEDVIESASLVGQKLFVLRLKDVKSQTTIYDLAGKKLGEISYPGIGAASVLIGKDRENEGFYTFQSPIMPPTIYSYNTDTGKQEVFASIKVPFDSTQYEVSQVFYTSKDGTKIPMFLAGRKGLKKDGSVQLLMTGYGGFNVSETPIWNPEYAWWMSQGGWFALPNLRGGGEYGEHWHEQAMFENKQNVFDDWFAAAEYLTTQHYTSSRHFAIRGRSNGGLLMGASMTQRPELFGAIWCGYPLLDMLRYQKFLFGRLWTTEYGSAENKKDFEYLLKYSPYQNAKPGKQYPAIMFFTGDNDTRVDPLHTRKMTPLMQSLGKNDRPILLHYSLKGGHSAGVSVSQLIEDEADELSFLWQETK